MRGQLSVADVPVRTRVEVASPAADEARRSRDALSAGHSRSAQIAQVRLVWVAAISLAILVGWALRLWMLGAWPLREDEATYAFWARSVWADPRFLHIWPDKPPIFLWLQAIALGALGSSAAAARVVSLMASAATISLTADVARCIGARYHRVNTGISAGMIAGIIAAWLVALSPFAISFGATGYTDSLLVFWGMLSLALALRVRPLWAGIALGAAIMTKQQGALYVPLTAGALYLAARAEISASQGSVSDHFWLRLLGKAVGGVLFVALPIMAWDASRWGVAPSPWDLGVRNYGALGFIPVSEWWARTRAWAGLAWYLTASWLAWPMLAIALIAGLAVGHRRTEDHTGRWLWWLLVIWSAGFLVLHIVTTVPAWDRYLLPLAPMLAVVVSVVVSVPVAALFARTRSRWAVAAGAAIVAVALLAGPGWTAARGGYPIGADHGAFTGFNEAMAWLESQAVDGTIVYHQLLGWQARYALYDAVERGDVDLRWFPNAVYLADNAAKAPRPRRFLIEPAWAATPDLYPALAARSLKIAPALRSGEINVWEITDEVTGFCDWCRCVAPLWPMLQPDNQQNLCTP